jgi:hypothetical protein
MLLKSFASLVLVSLSVSACSSTAAEAPTNGVDDVLKACELRVPWKSTSSSSCSTCIGLATTPRCACTDRDFAGKCSDQQAAKTAEPTCEGTPECVAASDRPACASIVACYASLAACRVRASALDGCVVAICDAYCE